MYRDEEGRAHLAWLDVDNAYLAKAYYEDALTTEKAKITYDKDIYWDKYCLSDIYISDSKLSICIDDWSKKGTYAVFLPKRTEDLKQTVTQLKRLI